MGFETKNVSTRSTTPLGNPCYRECNGAFLLTHAAMHQGMVALMNAMMPWPMKQNFRKYVVPWTVFTDPPVSAVGMTDRELQDSGIKYETIHVKYEDYGVAIAEAVETGFVEVRASKSGKIYGVTIVGEGSGEMINEWALAIQRGVNLRHIMMLQHTMGFLTKRAGDTWMMNRMKSSWLRWLMQRMYRL